MANQRPVGSVAEGEEEGEDEDDVADGEQVDGGAEEARRGELQKDGGGVVVEEGVEAAEKGGPGGVGANRRQAV